MSVRLAVVAVVAALVTTASMWVYAARQLERTPVAGLAAVTVGAPLNVLVVHAAGPEHDEPLSVAILQVREGVTPRLLSLPLDLEMTSPGRPPAPVRQHLAGGRDGLVAAVVDYTGIPIHHFVQLRLDGLEELADALAGPHCPDGDCLTEQFDVVREAGSFPLDLMTEHARTLKELSAALRRPTLLASPFAVKEIVDTGRAALSTDVDLGPRSALRLLQAVAEADLENFDVRVVPGFHDPSSGLTTPYWEQAETVFQSFRDGAPVPGDLGLVDPAEDLLVPARIRVLVLNGVGIEGLAGRVAGHLEEAGFDVVGADNADEFEDSMTTTVVAHRPGRAHEGELVAGELEGAVLEERSGLPEAVDVVVVVGRDWVR